MKEIKEAGLVGLLEALYALELDDQQWLCGVVGALAELCGDENHYIGFFYDASNVDDFKIWNPAAHNASADILANFEAFRACTTPELIRSTFRSLHMGSSRRTAHPHLEAFLAEREKIGWGDIFNLNSLDPSGIGCLLTIGGREPEFTLDAKTANVFRRIAHHLGAAVRCRRKLALSRGMREAAPVRASLGAEAILDSKGRFVHAEGPAQGKTARAQIKQTASAIDSMRTRQQRKHGRAALEAWHPLTGARWTIVDSFEENRRRYIVARENQVDALGFDALTDRERQVVVHAALGLSNKEIAYALGITEATVRVLMARAAGRVGVRTRKELLEHPAVSTLRARD